MHSDPPSYAFNNNACVSIPFNGSPVAGCPDTGRVVWQAHQVWPVEYPIQVANQSTDYWQQHVSSWCTVSSVPQTVPMYTVASEPPPVPIYNVNNAVTPLAHSPAQQGYYAHQQYFPPQWTTHTSCDYFQPPINQASWSNPQYQGVSSVFGATAFVDSTGLVTFAYDQNPQPRQRLQPCIEAPPERIENPEAHPEVSVADSLINNMPHTACPSPEQSADPENSDISVDITRYSDFPTMDVPNVENNVYRPANLLPALPVELFFTQTKPLREAKHQLDKDIKTLFLKCGSLAKEPTLTSLTKYMHDSPVFHEIVSQRIGVIAYLDKREKKENQGRSGALPSINRDPITPEDYLMEQIFPELNTTTILEIPSGSLAPFFLPTQNIRMKEAHKKAIVKECKKEYGINLSRYLDNDTRINESFWPFFHLLSDAFRRKIQAYTLSGKKALNIPVTGEDLRLHIKFINHLLLKCLLTFQACHLKKSQETINRFMAIINHHIFTACTIHKQLLCTSSSVNSQKALLETLYLECTRAQIALLTHNNMQIPELVTKYSRPIISPEEVFTADAYFKQHIFTQIYIQEHVLAALNFTCNKPDHHPMYMELIQLASRSDLFSPVYPLIIQYLHQDAEGAADLQMVSGTLPNQASEFHRHIVSVMTGMKELMEGTTMTPVYLQRFLNCAKEVWLPQFFCNIPKAYHRPFAVESPARLEQLIPKEYRALQERKQQAEYQCCSLDVVVDGMGNLSKQINGLLLRPKQIQAELNREIEALAEAIGIKRCAKALVKQTSSKRVPANDLPEADIRPDKASADKFSDVDSLTLAAPQGATEITAVRELLEKIDPNMTQEEVWSLLSCKLNESIDSFALCAETAHHLLFINRRLLAGLRVAIPRISDIYGRVKSARDRLPGQTPDELTAYRWLNQYFPDKELLSDNLLPLLTKVRKQQLDQAKKSINIAYSFLEHCLTIAKPIIGSDPGAEDHESTPSVSYKKFMLETSREALAKTTETKAIVATEIRVNELLMHRKHIMQTLGFRTSRGASGKSPLVNLAEEFRSQKGYFNKHNKEPGKFCNVDSSQLEDQIDQISKAFMGRGKETLS